ncbi:molybdate ABC transporter substrate-binding protein [Mucilaginibacter xinganensis]|uniref:Molybdate transport system substrate-binding protein n=1 Tax=Mucilaginibacter xinganensis TaxID=1234841 RepID=A0A223NQN3_9SPHI|nr:molybdate ABC transporter substrate-binding protein [Mucilaginibacter xinganensis]ASU32219.1 molybdate transport system substrate-binding protein [Mucilaginibacter xinganensis]
MKRVKILLAACLFLVSPVFAQNLKVAVAANLQAVIKVLQSDFKSKTGITIDAISGSSGNLANQVKNGAPYDVFLSADMSFPELLFKEGFSAKKPAVYAQGSLVICSSQDIGFENWERVLLTERIKKIAIANPAIAPYGKAAEEALKKKGILDDIKQKIVTGESIAQINTYIITGVVDVGFTTQALVKDPANKKPLYWKIIDPKLYAPIEQGMVILKHGAANPAAEKFYHYILSPAAKTIFEKYGYHLN